jgi:hypothetical protein
MTEVTTTAPEYTAEEQEYETTLNAYNNAVSACNTSYGSTTKFISRWGESKTIEQIAVNELFLVEALERVAEARVLADKLQHLVETGVEDAYEVKTRAIYAHHEAIQRAEREARDAERLAERLADRAVGAVVTYQTSWVRWTVEAVSTEGAILTRVNNGKDVKRRVTLEQLQGMNLWHSAAKAAELNAQIEAMNLDAVAEVA